MPTQDILLADDLEELRRQLPPAHTAWLGPLRRPRSIGNVGLIVGDSRCLPD